MGDVGVEVLFIVADDSALGLYFFADVERVVHGAWGGFVISKGGEGRG